MELIIMSAGLGSRFGGLKQLKPIDENGNFIIDYSIFDALRVGFDKIVFVIRKKNFYDFENTIGKRISSKVKVSYVFQDSNNLFFNEEKIERQKPLGTGQAVLLCKNEVSDKFAIINADDFYGYESFKNLKKEMDDLSENEFCIALFKLGNTISNFGNVKRGVAETKNGYLTEINECLVERFENKFLLTKLKNAKNISTQDFNSSNNHFDHCQTQNQASQNSNKTPQKNKNYFSKNKILVTKNHLVSMNMFGANKKLFDILETDFSNFLKTKENLKNGEFFLPDSITNAVKNKNIKVKTFATSAKWMGLTFKEDLDDVKENIKILKKKSIYPENLWGN